MKQKMNPHKRTPLHHFFVKERYAVTSRTSHSMPHSLIFPFLLRVHFITIGTPEIFFFDHNSCSLQTYYMPEAPRFRTWTRRRQYSSATSSYCGSRKVRVP